jgi:hypothetical protein
VNIASTAPLVARQGVCPKKAAAAGLNYRNFAPNGPYAAAVAD